MKTYTLNNFFARFLLIFLVHLMLKGFDQTFGDFFELSERGIYFSIFFNCFWLGAWYLSEFLNNKITHKKAFFRLLVNLLFGYSATFSTNAIYRLGDCLLFNNYSIWEDISVFNPEFTISLLLIYMTGYGIVEYQKTALHMKEEQLKSERLEKENLLAQYKSLIAQIEPHFLFNSLSVLSSIIHSDADTASDFVVKLSKTLRYIIEKNKFTLVPLNEELEMIEDYFFLLKTRFNQGIELVLEISDQSREEYYVPPAAIQVLIENAIKHNKQTVPNPLRITISETPTHLIVTNNLNKRETETHSTGIGLENVSKRYDLLSGKKVIIEESRTHFTVKLPVLTDTHHENFNN